MSSDEMRGQWAEKELEDVLSSTLVADFVLGSPRFTDRGIEKEVCDHIIEQFSQAVVVQLKTRAAVSSGDEGRKARWFQAKAIAAVKQIEGADRVLARCETRAHHFRRGLVPVPAGSLVPRHGVALVELGPGETRVVHLPRRTRLGLPIHCLAPSDFARLTFELQTVPDLFDYLDARASLPEQLAAIVGKEVILYSWYITHGSSFSELSSCEEAKENHRSLMSGTMAPHLRAKRLDDEEARVFQNLLDRVHWTDPDYASRLDSASVHRWNVDYSPDKYMTIAYELNSLRRVQRREIVRLLREKVELADQSDGPRFFAFQSPESATAFLFCASRDRGPEALERFRILSMAAGFRARGASAQIRKVVGVLSPSLKRIDTGCDFLFAELPEQITAEQVRLAEKFFKGERRRTLSDFPTSKLRSDQFRFFGTHSDEQVREMALHLKVRRNDPCPCGMLRKFKHCHGR